MISPDDLLEDDFNLSGNASDFSDPDDDSSVRISALLQMTVFKDHSRSNSPTPKDFLDRYLSMISSFLKEHMGLDTDDIDKKQWQKNGYSPSEIPVIITTSSYAISTSMCFEGLETKRRVFVNLAEKILAQKNGVEALKGLFQTLKKIMPASPYRSTPA
jgi:hypothetical protein